MTHKQKDFFDLTCNSKHQIFQQIFLTIFSSSRISIPVEQFFGSANQSSHLLQVLHLITDKNTSTICIRMQCRINNVKFCNYVGRVYAGCILDSRVTAVLLIWIFHMLLISLTLEKTFSNCF